MILPTSTDSDELRGNDIQPLLERILQLETELAQAKGQDQHDRAGVDGLTGLPNRFLFYDRLSELLKRSERNNLSFAVLYVDIDLYRPVKDTLGPEAGDTLLVTILDRMKTALRNTDIVAYIGGGTRPERISRLSTDEFGIALTDLEDSNAVTWILQRLFACFDEPVMIGDDEIYGGCCIGISVYPIDGDNVNSLVQHAGTARPHAKERAGQNKFMFYDDEMNHLVSQRFRLDAEMRHAVDENQFWIAYQPKIDLRTGKLWRWKP